MLKANVGISRKMSKDYNSHGFTINLEGEIFASPDDAEAVIERVRELYSLAEEALDRQIAESQSNDAMASRDADPQLRNGHSNGRPTPTPDRTSPTPDRPAPARNSHSSEARPTSGEPATNKQVQYLLTLAKRQRLQGPKLEAFIEEAIGHSSSPYDLSKKEAGAVIEALNPEAADNNRPHR